MFEENVCVCWGHDGSHGCAIYLNEILVTMLENVIFQDKVEEGF